jgi:predicted molibdopterin-dependent oxidoreductase YjgC
MSATEKSERTSHVQESRRIAAPEPGRLVRFTFDGETLEAADGETIAVALFAAGKIALRTTERLREPRGIFCNMGVCFECLVEVDGHANLRACQTVLRAGMKVRTQRGFGYRDVAPELGE